MHKFQLDTLADFAQCLRACLVNKAEAPPQNRPLCTKKSFFQ